jgi:hypothetical protein
MADDTDNKIEKRGIQRCSTYAEKELDISIDNDHLAIGELRSLAT